MSEIGQNLDIDTIGSAATVQAVVGGVKQKKPPGRPRKHVKPEEPILLGKQAAPIDLGNCVEFEYSYTKLFKQLNTYFKDTNAAEIALIFGENTVEITSVNDGNIISSSCVIDCDYAIRYYCESYPIKVNIKKLDFAVNFSCTSVSVVSIKILYRRMLMNVQLDLEFKLDSLEAVKRGTLLIIEPEKTEGAPVCTLTKDDARYMIQLESKPFKQNFSNPAKSGFITFQKVFGESLKLIYSSKKKQISNFAIGDNKNNHIDRMSDGEVIVCCLNMAFIKPIINVLFANYITIYMISDTVLIIEYDDTHSADKKDVISHSHHTFHIVKRDESSSYTENDNVLSI
jgi:hypothetical protein